MAAVQAEDIRASFLFVGGMNGHQELLGSTTTNCQEVAAFDFATVCGCDQLIVGQTHAHGGLLDLLMTDGPDLGWVAVVTLICNSGHSSVCSHLGPEPRWFQTCVLVGKFSWNIKSTRIQPVMHYRICPGITFGLLIILLRFWTNICPCWLDIMYQPLATKVICLHNKD